jgi:hypothetical protein
VVYVFSRPVDEKVGLTRDRFHIEVQKPPLCFTVLFNTFSYNQEVANVLVQRENEPMEEKPKNKNTRLVRHEKKRGKSPRVGRRLRLGSRIMKRTRSSSAEGNALLRISTERSSCNMNTERCSELQEELEMKNKEVQSLRMKLERHETLPSCEIDNALLKEEIRLLKTEIRDFAVLEEELKNTKQELFCMQKQARHMQKSVEKYQASEREAVEAELRVHCTLNDIFSFMDIQKKKAGDVKSDLLMEFSTTTLEMDELSEREENGRDYRFWGSSSSQDTVDC